MLAHANAAINYYCQVAGLPVPTQQDLDDVREHFLGSTISADTDAYFGLVVMHEPGENYMRAIV